MALKTYRPVEIISVMQIRKVTWTKAMAEGMRKDQRILCRWNPLDLVTEEMYEVRKRMTPSMCLRIVVHMLDTLKIYSCSKRNKGRR